MEKACSHKLSVKVVGGGDGATLQKWHKIKCSRASQMEFGLIYGRQTAGRSSDGNMTWPI